MVPGNTRNKKRLLEELGDAFSEVKRMRIEELDRPYPTVRTLTCEELSRIDYQPLDLCGNGPVGRCRLTACQDGKLIVIKKFQPCEIESFVREARHLSGLRNVQGLVRLTGVCVNTRELVTPYVGLALDQFVNKNTKEKDLWYICLQVTKAVHNMLRQQLCHNGLKCSNVRLARLENGLGVTLIGLERCTVTGSQVPGIETAACPHPCLWLAPEVKKGQPCTEASEAFSLSQLIVRLLILKGYFLRRTIKIRALEKWIYQARDLNPNKRPTVLALVKILERMLFRANGVGYDTANFLKRKFIPDRVEDTEDIEYTLVAKRQKTKAQPEQQQCATTYPREDTQAPADALKVQDNKKTSCFSHLRAYLRSKLGFKK